MGRCDAIPSAAMFVICARGVVILPDVVPTIIPFRPVEN